MFRNPALGALIGLLALWVIPWKGVALWKAARNGDKVWFIILLIVNTLAVLEIIYIFMFSKKSAPASSSPASSEPPSNASSGDDV